MTKLINKHNILVATDAEMWAVVKGKKVPASTVLSSKKGVQIPVKGGNLEVDGTALEFNISPAKDSESFLRNVNGVLEILKKTAKVDDLSFEPVADWGFDLLSTLPKEAVEMGCNADFNAWREAINPRPEVTIPFRSAGAHIHIGFCEDGAPDDQFYLEYISEFVRELDFYLGLPSVVLDAHKDSPRRRELYGKAGAFRPKKYGVEYRTLSNFWLASDKLKKWVYDATINAYIQFADGVR